MQACFHSNHHQNNEYLAWLHMAHAKVKLKCFILDEHFKYFMLFTLGPAVQCFPETEHSESVKSESVLSLVFLKEFCRGNFWSPITMRMCRKTACFSFFLLDGWCQNCGWIWLVCNWSSFGRTRHETGSMQSICYCFWRINMSLAYATKVLRSAVLDTWCQNVSLCSCSILAPIMTYRSHQDLIPWLHVASYLSERCWFSSEFEHYLFYPSTLSSCHIGLPILSSHLMDKTETVFHHRRPLHYHSLPWWPIWFSQSPGNSVSYSNADQSVAQYV